MTFHFLGFIHWTVSIYFFVLRLLHDSENDLLNSSLEYDPYCRPKLSDLYILWQSKLLENHTFHSGTYLYSPYMTVPPPPPDHAIQYRSIKDRNCGQGKKRKTTTTSNCLRRSKIYYQRKKTRQPEINPACWCQTKKEVCARHWEKDTIFSVLAIFLRICSFTLPILCY